MSFLLKMATITNYTPFTIIINIDQNTNQDHSNIENYKSSDQSIILVPNEKINDLALDKNSNLYICSENCRYLGHFNMFFIKIRPNLSIYVGLVVNGQIVLTNKDAIPSDVDFAISRTIDQSDPKIMIMNPYFYLLIVIILLVLVVAIIKYVYSSRHNISAN